MTPLGMKPKKLIMFETLLPLTVDYISQKKYMRTNLGQWVLLINFNIGNKMSKT